jgi:quercetin dioxygenase-like cupin family protein
MDRPAQSFDEFKAHWLSAGYDEAVERTWMPGTVLDVHTHPFAVEALVVAGQLWLTVGGEVRQLAAGDRFSLDAHVPHAERYGEQGATYWVARRQAR